MKARTWRLFLLAAGWFFLQGCKSDGNTNSKPLDDFENGTIHISCDESFRPVMDEQVSAYNNLHPNAHIIVHYKPEAECLRDLLVDSIRMVVATRGLSERERAVIVDSLGVGPEQLTVARDLVAVILHPSAGETFFTMQEIRELLSGKSKENLIPVFDGAQATSTVRFMLDSVLKGDTLSSRVVAAQNSREVIDYVKRVPNTVGFVGFSWIGNNDDTSQTAARRQLRLAYLESKDSAGAYQQPSQYVIYTNSYPMVRDLVYVLKEKHRGLGHAFAYFLQQSDKGQLIFRRSYLMPVLRPNYIRDARLNENINNQ
ncbi:MAG TPA: substrate-binding domain-containing protein [Flavisolibacter sp.]|nr:substrate-binding domain-containing protein [Flavisolibacter sp.]